VSDVGIRELRDHLSRYISQVREGSEVTVTDHGRAVARIVPLDRPRLLDRLIEEGRVTPAGDKRRSRPQHRIAVSEPVSPLVTDQRR
jgi:prevent-host-death family protein